MSSLRARLTLGVTLVLGAVLLATAALIARDVEREERAALDDRLWRTAELSRATARAAVQQAIPDPDGRLDAVLEATRSSLRLVLADRVLLETGDKVARRGRLRPGLSTITVGDVRYRAYATALDDPDLGGLAQLEVTTRLTALEDRLDRLRERLALLGGIALFVAAAGVFFASSLVLRPVRRLRAVTAGIATDEDLSRRVPADDGPRELRDLAGAFNAMLARLGRSSDERERALAATRRFAADAGHELRTPLTSAQVTLSALAKHPDLPAERRSALARDTQADLERLVELLDGLQALARGDAAAPFVPVDLAEVADAALADAAARHPSTRFEPELAPHATRPGWEPGLRALVTNLLDNAARHGGGRVRFTLRPDAIRVEDDGPGIPAADRERVFEPFARGDGSPGHGLGLAIVRQQALLHGATVEVGASEELGGARFDVRFEAWNTGARARCSTLGSSGRGPR